MRHAFRFAHRPAALAALIVPLAVAACTSGRGEIVPALTPVPSVALVDERTGQALGASPDAALTRSAAGASAGTLLARSPDGSVCVFADGRGGWNRAAC